MRTKLAEYYPLKEEELKQHWENCTIVLDTNVLLDFYRLPNNITKQLIQILTQFQEKLWIPYHVGKEYNQQKHLIISGQKRVHGEIVEILEGSATKIRDKRHPVINIAKISKSLMTLAESVKASEKREQRKVKFEEVDDLICELFKDRVGDELSLDAQQKILTEGAERYQKDIPPGYKDRGKKNEKDPFSEYGDLIIWTQIMNHAQKEKKPILLITQEKKDDWWWSIQGAKKGARPELVKEIRDKAGVKFVMYDVQSFIHMAEEQNLIKLGDKELRQLTKAIQDSIEVDTSTMEASILETVIKTRLAEGTISLSPGLSPIASLSPSSLQSASLSPSVSHSPSASPSPESSEIAESEIGNDHDKNKEVK